MESGGEFTKTHTHTHKHTHTKDISNVFLSI